MKYQIVIRNGNDSFVGRVGKPRNDRYDLVINARDLNVIFAELQALTQMQTGIVAKVEEVEEIS